MTLAGTAQGKWAAVASLSLTCLTPSLSRAEYDPECLAEIGVGKNVAAAGLLLLPLPLLGAGAVQRLPCFSGGTPVLPAHLS